jgi:hypothetical protein
MRMALVDRGAGATAETVVGGVGCGHNGIHMGEPWGSGVGGGGGGGGGGVGGGGGGGGGAGRRATARGTRGEWRLRRKDLDAGDGVGWILEMWQSEVVAMGMGGGATATE